MTSWLALVFVDAVTVTTFARCFSGPGELWILVPVCIGAHLLAHLGRRFRREGHRGAGYGIWALTILFAAYVPVALVDASHLQYGVLALGGTWQAVGHQLTGAWSVFSNQVAPVSETHGLVLAAAWASALVAMAAEALDADSALPAIVSLVPAFDIVVFTGTLGTTTGRAPELAVLAAASVLYLTGARNRTGEHVVTARVEGLSGRSGTRSLRRSGSPSLRVPSTAAGLALIAGISAGVIGPLLPGATSSALLAWHGGVAPVGSPVGPGGTAGPGPVSISNSVDTAEEEVTEASTPLFWVYSTTPTREIMYVDDDFNGQDWGAIASTGHKFADTFSASVPDLEAHPLAPTVGKRSEEIEEALSVVDLAGPVLPTPGPVISIDGGAITTVGLPDGPVAVAQEDFGNNYSWGVRADISLSPAVAQQLYDAHGSPAPPYDLQLPPGVPAKVVALAHSLVTPGMNEAAKATAIQDYLLSDRFRYVLPTVTPKTPAGPYAALSQFLFQTRTGYCQQFAGAFGVLARIDGLPTRLVVGFLPGTIDHDKWLVTGAETHAWPEVYFPGAGWVDFDPTPGAGSPPYASVPTTTLPNTTGTTSPKVTGSSSPAHNFGHAAGGGGPATTPFPTTPPVASTGTTHPRRGSGDLAALLLALLAAGVVWAIGVPLWRSMQWRRRREPGRAVLLAWRAALVALAAVGMHRRRAETHQEFARRVHQAGILSDDADAALRHLAAMSNQALFARKGPSEEESGQAPKYAAEVRRSAERSMSLWGRAVFTLDPRDLIALS